MSQRLKTNSIEHVNCAKYNKILQREKERSTKLTSSEATKTTTSNNMKCKLAKKQPQNIVTSARTESNCNINGNLIDDDNEYSNRQYKSENNREPWSDLLKRSKNVNSSSTFSNFDPLRTLHFLARELQFQMEAIIPQQTPLHKIINDMQEALKRVPPEVASAVHLQQAIDLLPINKKLTPKSSKYDQPEKLPVKCETATQTAQREDDTEKIHKLMEESTLKLENSCRQMEILCGRLKAEKAELDRKLQSEKDTVRVLRVRVNDLENENNNIEKLKLENIELHQKVTDLNSKLVSECVPRIMQMQKCVDELQESKSKLQHDYIEYKNKFDLCLLEKSKIQEQLNVRTEQVHEIQKDMTDLQRIIDEQLRNLHKDAQESMPRNGDFIEHGQDFAGDGLVPSTIHSSDSGYEKKSIDKMENVLPCGGDVGRDKSPPQQLNTPTSLN